MESRAIAALEDVLGDGTPLAVVPVDAIASRAGISRSTFYLYFADKGELLALATRWLKDQLFEVRVAPQEDVPSTISPPMSPRWNGSSDGTGTTPPCWRQ